MPDNELSEKNTCCRLSAGEFFKDVLLFVSGVVVGATAAILYAPQTGERTRQQIAEKYENVKDRARDLGEDVLDKLEDLREIVNEQVESKTTLVGEKKRAILEGINAVQAKLSVLKSRVLKQGRDE